MKKKMSQIVCDETSSYTIDRFEGDFAVLIDEEMNTLNVPKTLVPLTAKEGSMLSFLGEGFVEDMEQTSRKSEEVRSRFENLKKRL